MDEGRKIAAVERAQFYRLVKTHGLDDEPVDEEEPQDQKAEDSNWML